MGLYIEQVLPRIVNVACATKVATRQRRRVCEGLAGDVVEIGFGSGLSVPFYRPRSRTSGSSAAATLTRPVVDLLTGAGFTIRELDVYYEKGSPKVVGANSLGVAQPPLT
jgi:hypothetical protein